MSCPISVPWKMSAWRPTEMSTVSTTLCAMNEPGPTVTFCPSEAERWMMEMKVPPRSSISAAQRLREAMLPSAVMNTSSGAGV